MSEAWACCRQSKTDRSTGGGSWLVFSRGACSKWILNHGANTEHNFVSVIGSNAGVMLVLLEGNRYGCTQEQLNLSDTSLFRYTLPWQQAWSGVRLQ